MHNNYYFLRQLTQALRVPLIGSVIDSCFSQEKDELIITFRKSDSGGSFFLKAMLTAQFSTLYFPESFNRAKSNSVNLFPEVIGEEVREIVQHKNERSFYLVLSNQKALLFKLFGNRSNIVYFEQNQAKALFHKKFPKDLELNLQQLHRQLQPTKAEYLLNLPAPEKVYPTFGDLPGIYLKTKGYESALPEKKWDLIQTVRHELENPAAFYVIKVNNQTRLSLLPVGEIKKEFTSPITALKEFVQTYLADSGYERNYRLAHQNLTRKFQAASQTLQQIKLRLKALETEASYAQTADVIMANLTVIPPRAESIVLFDFYLEKERLFKLKANESPQKFAERLYKKSKNQQIEVTQLKERLQEKEEELLQLEIALQELATISDYRTLKAFVKEHVESLASQPTVIEKPFRVFQTNGFQILVGKSAQNNDVLTQQFTFKEDLWLHAKDVSGSHVVIKYQAGKTFPEPVIYKAAQLAAYYSKRKTDSLCPVLYTPKKYVRKPKGAAPGQVVVEREKVILVKPENPFEKYPGS
ncbi:NFACT RNA binding domain-containing protein [Adhaeribacter radiodurans]|uniref:Fibronectin/fibrinogen-binding protein n=1 Tax=Adhaeribacter radiodurans TaxID=2745197 RepID=A0A7L7LA70_9BACT|nr:NFACT RNA binding domain-containing protein [Adhaeribacter radiodurans]QMU29742.1 fibronectin/fibrinogen-binding protein [Adhaeribacter radiodurans]